MAEQEEIKQVISEEITKQLADSPFGKKEDPLKEDQPEKPEEEELVQKEKELPTEIQKCAAMGIDEEKCWNIAGIFGYPREGKAEQEKLSDNSYTPATQEDAVDMIEARNQQITKLQSGQQNNSVISKELETTKAKLCAAEAVIDAVRKAELEKYTEAIKKVDPEGKFMEQIKDLDHQTKVGLCKTFIQKFQATANVNLSRGDVSSTGSHNRDQATQNLFGMTEAEIVEYYTGEKQ
jgi:hypothetical protein